MRKAGAGVVRLDPMAVTHVFNPSSPSPETLCASHYAPRVSLAYADSCLAWSPDGTMLYRLGHANDVMCASKGPNALSFSFRVPGSDLLSSTAPPPPALAALSLDNERLAMERPLYALDVSNRHACPLRLAAAYGPPADGACAVSVEWQARASPRAEAPERYSASVETRLLLREARECVQGSGDGEGEESGLRRWRGALGCGAGAMWAGIPASENRCTLARDPRDGHLVAWCDSATCTIAM